LEAWKRRAEERKRLQKRASQQYQKLKTAMERHQEDFNMEKERVIACVLSFLQFYEDKEQVEKEEKIINDFLCQLPDGGIGHQILEIKDIERVLDNETRSFKVESTLLRDFAAIVRAECVMEQNFFSFYDIPDLIVKKKY
jgi:DNA repair exonuclease SbcCD ATPase subunit